MDARDATIAQRSIGEDYLPTAEDVGQYFQ